MRAWLARELGVRPEAIALERDQRATTGVGQLRTDRLIAMRDTVHDNRSLGGSKQLVTQTNQTTGSDEIGLADLE